MPHFQPIAAPVAPQPRQATTRSIPLPSLPWLEMALFGVMALILALS